MNANKITREHNFTQVKEQSRLGVTKYPSRRGPYMDAINDILTMCMVVSLIFSKNRRIVGKVSIMIVHFVRKAPNLGH